MRSSFAAACLIVAVFSLGQAAPLRGQESSLDEALKQPMQTPEEAQQQLKAFVLSRIAPLERADTADDWQREAALLRARILEDVVLRGVPRTWREWSPQVVWHEVIETDHGYRIRKLRYEALPGLWIPALLYEPDQLESKVPAVLNVNGHEKTGKSSDYKQLRCINLAKRGVLALNLEWIGYGQLRLPGWVHGHLAKLDLCGRSGLSVFYLVMQRGLEILLEHPHADPERVAMTGLSGGGWQTIILSSLETRVRLAVPVAGFSSLRQRLEHPGSIGDLEQNPCDLASIADYVHLNALMVPRPLLLIYNSRDDCCFVASTVKPNTYEPVVPFYEQAGAAEQLEYYVNDEPGTHNYEQDNRQQLYRFLDAHFFTGEQRDGDEIPSQAEVRTPEELLVPLPGDNADFHTLAAHAAEGLPRLLEGSKVEGRKRLEEILRFRPHAVTAERFTGPQDIGGLHVRHLKLMTGGEWSLTGTIVEGESCNRHVVLLADAGFASQADHIRTLVESGARVLAIDPILIGRLQPSSRLYQNAMLIATVGERPLGIQAAQVAAVSRYFARVFAVDAVTIEAVGPRVSLIARCAAALEDSVIHSVNTAGEPASLKEFLRPEADYADTPEIYCFGLLESFDIPQLVALD